MIGIALIGLLATPAVLSADGPPTGGLVTTLGNDVVAVETYTRTAQRLQGDILLRVPGTTRFHYELTFASDGSVRRSIFEVRPLGAPNVDDQRRLTLEFDKDQVRIVSAVGGEQQMASRPAAGARQVLFMGGYGASFGLYSSFGMYEHLFAQLKDLTSESKAIMAFGAATAEPAQRFVRKISPTEFDVDFFKMAWSRITVDETGRIVGADATGTTEKTVTKRVDAIDLSKMEKEFVALDKSGKGIGSASPNVEAKGKAGDASITVRYGSPRLRGRSGVMAALTASGKVWRTGANEAATIEIDRDVTIGGAAVPKGRYSLFTLPTSAGVQLIVNKEVGQWGLAYKEAQDFVRIPMTVSQSATPTENFTISIAAAGSTSELRMAWDTFVWSVPIASVAK